MVLETIRIGEDEAALIARTFPREQCDEFWGNNGIVEMELPAQHKIEKRFLDAIEEFNLDKAIQAGRYLRRHAINEGLPSLLVTDFPLAVHPYSNACLASYLHSRIQHFPHEGNPIMRVENVGQLGLASSRNAFAIPWHTENAYALINQKPKYLGLYSVRNQDPQQGQTGVADINEAIGFLDARTIEILCEPHFRFSHPDHWTGRPATYNRPVLMPAQDGSNCFDCAIRTGEALVANSDEARFAVDRLTKALTQVGKYRLLKPGSFLVINNSRVAHMRNTVNPALPRLLLRTYLRGHCEARE